MASKAKTWKQKRDAAKPEHIVVLDKAFAGVPAGRKLLIPSPRLIEDFVNALPPGRAATLAAMREDLARAAGADAACPVATSIFTRVAAEAALEDLKGGAKPAEITPFWRVVGPKDPVAARLSCGVDFIETQRRMEADGKAA